ncbi:hypothetical protein N039_12395 [Staphylococcus sp. EGD-HP3]|nr:hypothetical protein N039_12395 [Staphylococcus sp. EGD-HP3]
MLDNIKQIAEIAFYVASTTAIVTQLLKDDKKK